MSSFVEIHTVINRDETCGRKDTLTLCLNFIFCAKNGKKEFHENLRMLNEAVTDEKQELSLRLTGTTGGAHPVSQ
jgi:hypothetical protein